MGRPKLNKELCKCGAVLKDNFYKNEQTVCKKCVKDRAKKWKQQSKDKPSPESLSRWRKTYVKKLKEKDPLKLKARNSRGNWLRLAREANRQLEKIPSRADIEHWLKSQEKDNQFLCYYTGEWVDSDDVQIDHKQPLYLDGSFGFENLAITSKKINQAKGRLTEKEFSDLLRLIKAWDDKGKYLLSRLRMSGGMFNRGKR